MKCYTIVQLTMSSACAEDVFETSTTILDKENKPFCCLKDVEKKFYSLINTTMNDIFKNVERKQDFDIEKHLNLFVDKKVCLCFENIGCVYKKYGKINKDDINDGTLELKKFDNENPEDIKSLRISHCYLQFEEHIVYIIKEFDSDDIVYIVSSSIENGGKYVGGVEVYLDSFNSFDEASNFIAKRKEIDEIYWQTPNLNISVSNKNSLFVLKGKLYTLMEKLIEKNVDVNSDLYKEYLRNKQSMYRKPYFDWLETIVRTI